MRFANLQVVGAADTGSLNRLSRVGVRQVVCRGEADDRATCTYEADRCVDDKRDADAEGWCRRRTRFVRDGSASPMLPFDDD